MVEQSPNTPHSDLSLAACWLLEAALALPRDPLLLLLLLLLRLVAVAVVLVVVLRPLLLPASAAVTASGALRQRARPMKGRMLG